VITMIQKKTMRSIAVAAIALLMSHAAVAGKAEDTFNIAFDTAPSTLDAYKESDRPGLSMIRMVYTGLIQKDMQTGKFEPALASSFKFINDKTMEFVLRKDVVFHNGEKMTADDVVYTLNLVASKDYNARFQNTVSWIDRVEKVSDSVVRIHLKEPFPLALEMLSENLPIYPKKYYQADMTQMGTKPIGTGPYKLTEIQPGSRYVFERFDGYFGKKPAIKKLVVRILPDMNTQYAELLSGGLDWVWRLPPDGAKKLATQKKLDVKSISIMRVSYISINPNFQGGKSPIGNVKVRQAINMAIDRESIRNALIGGSSKLTNAACNPLQFGCTTDVKAYKYDVAGAKKLMEEAGYKNGFTMDMVVGSPPRAVSEVIASNLAQIGIKINLIEQQFSTATTGWREGKVPLLSINWGSYGIGDVALSTSNFFGGGADDTAKNPEVIKLIKQADVSVDPDLRKQNYAQALKIIADEAYWVPLWSHSLNYAQTKDVDFSVDADEFPRFYKASWK
jgi:peptide/nickel transport system substrate-binding protein